MNSAGPLIPNIHDVLERKRKAILTGKTIQLGEAVFLINKSTLDDPDFVAWRRDNRVELIATPIAPYSEIGRLYQLHWDDFYRVTFGNRRHAVLFKLTYDVVK